MGKKFVGLGGLKHFWTKAKTWIAGQITSEVTAKIAEIVANAPEDLDTLKEIADWISTHANDASAMNTQINTNKNDIAALQTSVAEKAAATHTHDDRYYTETEVDTKLSGKSDTGHTHTKSQITDFPTSLPANGGTASKVGNSLTFGSKTYDGSSAQEITASDLGALTAHQTIKQDGITGATVNRFGTCSTAAATAAKTVSITDGTFSLEAGARVSVKFSKANTADTPTLNVAKKKKKNIFHKGAKITTGVNKALLAGVCDFIYDGTQWHLIGNYIDTNTTYSAATQSSAGLMSADDKTKLDNLGKYTKEYKVSAVTSETTKYIKLGEFNPTEGGNISCRITGDNFDDTIDINILGGNFDNTSVFGHYSTKSKRTQGIRVSSTVSQNIGIYLKISQLTTATVKVAVDKKYQSRITMSESGLGQYEGVLTDISFSSYNGLFGNLTGNVSSFTNDNLYPYGLKIGQPGGKTHYAKIQLSTINMDTTTIVIKGTVYTNVFEILPTSKCNARTEYGIQGVYYPVTSGNVDNFVYIKYTGYRDIFLQAPVKMTLVETSSTAPKGITFVDTTVLGYVSSTHTHDDRYYTETEVDTKLSGKSDTGHTHTKSQITDFPTSLPANGGTADTANNGFNSSTVTDSTPGWGYLTSGNGYSNGRTYSFANGGGIATAEKDAKSSLQVDGDLYVHEGQDKVATLNDIPTSLPANGGTADTATTAAKLGRNGNTGLPMTFNWSGQGGQPSWLWGGNDGSNMYVYNPSNFSVNTATTAYKIRIGNSNPTDGDIWIQ